jgi:hypothetical protein
MDDYLDGIVDVVFGLDRSKENQWQYKLQHLGTITQTHQRITSFRSTVDLESYVV